MPGSVPLQGLENCHNCCAVIEPDTTLLSRLLKWLETELTTLDFIISEHQSPASFAAVRTFELLPEG